MSNHTGWMAKEIFDFSTGRPVGFDVYRVHDPYTDSARIEYLQPRCRFQTEAETLAAIAKATDS